MKKLLFIILIFSFCYGKNNLTNENNSTKDNNSTSLNYKFFDVKSPPPLKKDEKEKENIKINGYIKLFFKRVSNVIPVYSFRYNQKMHFKGKIMAKLNGSQMIMEALNKEGVEVVFGYPGGAALNIFDETYKQKC